MYAGKFYVDPAIAIANFVSPRLCSLSISFFEPLNTFWFVNMLINFSKSSSLFPVVHFISSINLWVNL